MNAVPDRNPTWGDIATCAHAQAAWQKAESWYLLGDSGRMREHGLTETELFEAYRKEGSTDA